MSQTGQEVNASSDRPPSMRRTVRGEIGDIAARYVAAHDRLLDAQSSSDREAAEDDRRQAMGDLWACRQQLAELLLLMLRCAVELNPGVLHQLLMETIQDEVGNIALVVAREVSRE